MVIMENKLLDELINDQKKISDSYKPSKYWLKKTLSAYREIKKNGLNDFRSSSDNNTAATAFGDNTIIIEGSPNNLPIGMRSRCATGVSVFAPAGMALPVWRG